MMAAPWKQRENAQHAAALAAFDRETEQHALQGHWKMELPANMEPRSRLKAMHWKGSLIREQLLRAGDLIGVNEADRAPSRPGGLRSIIVTAGLLSRSGNRSRGERRDQWLR